MSTESELRDWRSGQTNAERMCAAILAIEGYTDIDPQAPLGGPDDKKDILARRAGHRFVVAVFFPHTHQNFASIKRKFAEDRRGVARHRSDGFVFMVNQPLTLGERQQLEDLGGPLDELYHLERLRHALDSPSGYGLRLEYLRRSMTVEEQIAFFSTLNPDLTERFLAKDRQRGTASGATPAGDAVHLAALGAAGQPQSTSDYGEVLGDIAAPMSRLSISTLLLLHRAVTVGSPIPSSLRGRLRTVKVWISDGSSKPLYTPPAADQVPEQLTEAVRWWRSTYPTLVGALEEDVLHGLAKLCHEVLMIHPFLDGNKRLAVAIVDLAAIELLGRGVGAELWIESAAYLRTFETPRGGNLNELAKLIRAALV
jgi:hypothetical protein